jgi:hypothetical protein
MLRAGRQQVGLHTRVAAAPIGKDLPVLREDLEVVRDVVLRLVGGDPGEGFLLGAALPLRQPLRRDRNQSVAVEAERIRAVEVPAVGVAVLRDRAPAPRDRRQAAQRPADAQQSVPGPAAVRQGQLRGDRAAADRHPQRHAVPRRTIRADREPPLRPAEVRRAVHQPPGGSPIGAASRPVNGSRAGGTDAHDDKTKATAKTAGVSSWARLSLVTIRRVVSIRPQNGTDKKNKAKNRALVKLGPR